MIYRVMGRMKQNGRMEHKTRLGGEPRVFLDGLELPKPGSLGAALGCLAGKEESQRRQGICTFGASQGVGTARGTRTRFNGLLAIYGVINFSPPLVMATSASNLARIHGCFLPADVSRGEVASEGPFTMQPWKEKMNFS
jgi:hypothetical protein